MGLGGQPRRGSDSVRELRILASVARTGPEGRGPADVRTCGRVGGLQRSYVRGMMMGAKCGAGGRAVMPVAEKSGGVGGETSTRGPRPR